MKNLKLMGIALLTILLTGCMSINITLDLKKDGSGSILYVFGVQEEFSDSATDELDLKELEKQGIVVEDHTYEKNGVTYIGKKATIPFETIEEANELLSDMTNEDSVSENLKITKDGKNISIQQAKTEGYEQSMEYLSYLDYKWIIKIDGKIIESNADEISKDKTELTWNTKTIFSEGINLKYEENSMLNSILLIAGISAIIAAVVVVVMIVIKKIRTKKDTKKVSLDNIEIIDL